MEEERNDMATLFAICGGLLYVIIIIVIVASFISWL